MSSRSLTVAQLCDHFEQRELAKDNAWRSHGTKKIYKAYLTRWILPHWRENDEDVKTVQSLMRPRQQQHHHEHLHRRGQQQEAAGAEQSCGNDSAARKNDTGRSGCASVA